MKWIETHIGFYCETDIEDFFMEVSHDGYFCTTTSEEIGLFESYDEAVNVCLSYYKHLIKKQNNNG